MGVDFQSKIQDIKNEKIGNLNSIRSIQSENFQKELSDFTPEEVKSFFAEKGINRESLIKFLLSQDEDYGILVEGALTNIDSGGEFYEEILLEIESRGTFSTPQELVQTIAEYIKENMSYDALEALPQLISDDGTIKDFSLVLNHPESGLSSYHLQFLGNILEVYKGEGLLECPEEYREMIRTLLYLTESNNPDGLKKYLMGLNEGEKESFLFILTSFQREEQRNNRGKSDTLTNILKNKRVGVCAHFSMIAKKIYNEMIQRKSQSIKFTSESEVMYVLNSPQQHAYNLLVYEGADGKVRKQVFDVTTFLNKGTLFISEEALKRRNPEKEIYVENIENNSDSHVI